MDLGAGAEIDEKRSRITGTTKFLPRSKRLLISWLQSSSVVILKPRKIKSDTVSTVSPSISHEVVGPDAMILLLPVYSPSFSLSTTALCSHNPLHIIIF